MPHSGIRLVIELDGPECYLEEDYADHLAQHRDGNDCVPSLDEFRAQHRSLFYENLEITLAGLRKTLSEVSDLSSGGHEIRLLRGFDRPFVVIHGRHGDPDLLETAATRVQRSLHEEGFVCRLHPAPSQEAAVFVRDSRQPLLPNGPGY